MGENLSGDVDKGEASKRKKAPDLVTLVQSLGVTIITKLEEMKADFNKR